MRMTPWGEMSYFDYKKKIEFSNQEANNINKIRDDFFLGKNFDYRLSVIDLLFLRGPESGFLIRNFNKKN